MGILSNRCSVIQLIPGDHIYTWRAAYTYSHHGIYVGDSKVIHFTRGRDQELGTGTSIDNICRASSAHTSGIHGFPCLRCGTTGLSHGVIESCLDCFLCGDPLYLFEYGVNWKSFLGKLRGGTSTMAKADSVEKTLYRSRVLVEHGFGEYNLFENNCEDFALYCKTELLIVDKSRLGRSGQAASFFAVPMAVLLASPLSIVAGPITIAAASASLYCAGRYSHDIGVRKDVIQLEVGDLVFNLSHAASSRRVEEGLVIQRMRGEEQRLFTNSKCEGHKLRVCVFFSTNSI